MKELNEFLAEVELSNHQLVGAYQEKYQAQLSHKVLQKARLGKRPLSKKMQQTVVDAINAALLPEKLFKKSDFRFAEGTIAPL